MTTPFIGRRRELHSLASFLDDPEIGIVLVTGRSGAGKTTLVQKVISERSRQGAIIGSGRYSGGGGTLGLRPILEALARATDCALDKLYDPFAGAESLRAVLGDRLSLLMASGLQPVGVGTAERGAVGPFRSNQESTTRLFDAMLKVLRWLDGFGAPVVLFIDDFRRAPVEARNFVAAAERDTQGRICTFVLAGRESGDAMHSSLTMRTEQVAIGACDPGEQVELLAATLQDPAKANAVADWLGDGPDRLPLDIIEAGRALVECSALVPSESGWGIDDQRAAVIDRHDFAERVVASVQRLPETTRNVARALAIWSEPIELPALGCSLAIPDAEAADSCALLKDIGLLGVEPGALRIRHDRLRVALLRGGAEREIAELADRMSKNLSTLDEESWLRIDRNALRLRIMAGLDGVEPDRWREKFLRAAIVARNGADFFSASAFAEAAFGLREVNAVAGRSVDRLIVREAAMAAANRHDGELTRTRCGQLVASSRSASEIAEAYEWSASALRLAGDPDAAWIFCNEGLSKFGVRIPVQVRPSKLALAIADWKLARLWPTRRSDIDESAELALARLAQLASQIAWERAPEIAALIAIRLGARARRRGLRSAFWTITDAFIAASISDYAEAARLGEVAITEFDGSSVHRGFCLYVAYYFGLIWARPLASLRSGTSQAYELSIAEGDMVGAAYALRMEGLMSWRTDPSLAQVAATLRSVDVKAERLGDRASRAEITRLKELVRRIIDEPFLAREIPESFISGAFTEPPLTVLEYLALANDWSGITRLAQSMRDRRSSLNSHPGAVLWRFYENLARLKIGLKPLRSDIGFITRAARLNPADHLAKQLLLQAEDLRRRRSRECLKLYAAAVEASAAGSSLLEAGLCAECAAAAALAFADGAAKLHYEQRALDIWAAWGAIAKLPKRAVLQNAADAEQLAQAQSDAALSQRAERAKSRFLAEAGHELRTPLQGMQSMLDLAVDDPGHANLRELRDALESLNSVVDDLTELGALGADAPLHLRPTDIAGLVNSEAAIARALATQKELQLGVDIGDSARASFDTDGSRIRQVVRNLLSNAIKYSDRGDIVLRVGAHDAGDGLWHIELSVDDTGPGIDDAHLARLFEPFDRAGRDDEGGLGLGLTVARRIAQRLDGTLVASDRREGGARFVFAFPARLSNHRAQESGPLPVQRILLVEDVTLIRRGLSNLLRRDGHIVAEAGSIAEAIVHWRENRFDLVILDLSLPDGDGLSLLTTINAEMRRPAPALVLTAAIDATTDKRVRIAGARLLRKPISNAELRTRLAELLGWSAPKAAAAQSDEDWSALACEARVEIVRLGSELIDLERRSADQGDICRAAHRLAGLAAQFHAPRIAELADLLEAGAGNSPPDRVVDQLEAALGSVSG